MRFVIVTGMSGAGKSIALKIFEDVGYYCVDNLPPSLIPDFADICISRHTGIETVALGIDIRGGKLFDDLFAGLQALETRGLPFEILFLDASNEALLNRYKETRHVHPLAKNDLPGTGIVKERELLAEIKQKATYIIDTSFTQTRQLKEKIIEIFVDKKSFVSLMIHVLSFGYKYGIPDASDLVFDVRFLPNPFYLPDLKYHTGLDEDVRQYVMQWDVSRRFLHTLDDMLQFLIPNYISEGKNQLIVSVGCTGGRHRSVTLATAVYNTLRAAGHSAVLTHRDIDRDEKKSVLI